MRTERQKNLPDSGSRRALCMGDLLGSPGGSRRPGGGGGPGGRLRSGQKSPCSPGATFHSRRAWAGISRSGDGLGGGKLPSRWGRLLGKSPGREVDCPVIEWVATIRPLPPPPPIPRRTGRSDWGAKTAESANPPGGAGRGRDATPPGSPRRRAPMAWGKPLSTLDHAPGYARPPSRGRAEEAAVVPQFHGVQPTGTMGVLGLRRTG